MSVLTITRAPTSYQFRLATFNGRKPPSVILSRRVHKLGRRIRCSSGSRDNGKANVTEQTTNSSFSVDDFSRWSGDNNRSQQPKDPQPETGWSRGIVGAVVAGLILVSGLALASFSISKSISKLKQKPEPLAAHEEESWSSAAQNDTVEEDGSKGDNVMLDNGHLEDKKALQALPGKVLVPAVVDQVQGQALAALQVLKVVEGDVQPGDLCTRREYARWLVSASSALSRNSTSKVYPAMYIENVTELAFDDITPKDPDFSSIQGLAEAGLIASKLSRHDMNPLDQDTSSMCFSPECTLSRQDLVSWKMSLEKRLLPEANRTILQQCSGFIDIDKISPDAWPALIADLSAGEQGIIGLAFGYTRLFQPDKPVTKAQAAIALSTGEASDIVSEELARIEAESVAEKAVAAHTSLVDQVEKDLNANFEKGFLLEREKINAVEKMAEEAKQELEKLKAEREKENIKLMKERASVDSEMEVFSKLRHQVDEQLQSILSNKVEISYEKERLNKLQTDVEIENREIERLRDELEAERKALSMARSWAEDEARRAREQAKVLEEARGRWESQGIKVVVDQDLREEANAGVTWLSARNQFSIEGTKTRATNLIQKLKAMSNDLQGRSKETIDYIIQKMIFLISQLKEWASRAGSSIQEGSVRLSLTVKDGAQRVVGDFRGGVEKLTHNFKT